MNKISVTLSILILIMLIPAINMVMENDSEKLDAYTVETELFGNYLADKPIRTSETTITFYGSFGSGHNIDPSTITRIDAYHDYFGWFYDIENESQFIWNYISSTNSVNLSFDDGFGVVYLNIKGNGTFYNEYWSQAFGETIIYCDGLNEDDILFYARIFYNDPDIEYSEINSYDEREIGMIYNGNDDSNGYSAIDIGTAMFTEGLFGMLPRKDENDDWIFPLLNHAINAFGITGSFFTNMIWSNIEGWLHGDFDQTYSENYVNNNWENDFHDDDDRYFLDDGNKFAGYAIIWHEDDQVYMKHIYGFWIRGVGKILDDDEMQAYKTSTSNFE